MRTSGVIQPLVVRPLGRRYQLIAGERRWRAAQRAGLSKVPVVVREVPDELALELTLVENIQREDLNPIEQARAFARLITEFNLRQEDVAERTGKDRVTIANALRLLKLPAKIQAWIEEGRLSAGHGRALLGIADEHVRLRIAERAARGGLTVRQVERAAAAAPRQRAKLDAADAQLDVHTRAALEELQRALGTAVSLRLPGQGRPGQLIIEYYDDRQLADLYERLVRAGN